MDQALTIVNLNEEVSNITVELEDSKPSSDNTVPPLPPSPVNQNNVAEKRSMTFVLGENSRNINSISSKK
jgi:hypothetical protein